MKTLDVITIGRSSVDLYGQQVGGRLEDMGSFAKYIGGSPTNIACGTARLGLRSAVITRVGDEHMGRFIREQLIREGVDVRGVAEVGLGWPTPLSRGSRSARPLWIRAQLMPRPPPVPWLDMDGPCPP